VTPQGGMTGLAGGGVPITSTVILSLERMRAIEEVDVDASTPDLPGRDGRWRPCRSRRTRRGCSSPLDLGGRGSAQVGGNASTNAGGNRVVRYGMMRALVAGRGMGAGRRHGGHLAEQDDQEQRGL
ncbi:MAG: FAD-binding protein, partial [Caulobacteraceae bacterium]